MQRDTGEDKRRGYHTYRRADAETHYSDVPTHFRVNARKNDADRTTMSALARRAVSSSVSRSHALFSSRLCRRGVRWGSADGVFVIRKRWSSPDATLLAAVIRGGSVGIMLCAAYGSSGNNAECTLTQIDDTQEATICKPGMSVLRWLRLWFAWCRLMLLAMPLGLLGFNGWFWGGWFEDLAWNYALWATQQAGPTAVKLAQWASSRDDRFPESFCARFSTLQSAARPHDLGYTVRALERALGREWQRMLRLESLVGSGCVAQVYRGTVLRHTKDSEAGEVVAVKVVHPAVKERVLTDLALIRLAARLVETAAPSAKWLSLPEAVDEFGRSLSAQMDMCREASNLDRLGCNFQAMPTVRVPRPRRSLSSNEVLVQDFAVGVPVSDVVSRKVYTKPEIRTKLSRLGVDCVCKMIFHDNLIHGDLHPGNLLVDLEDPNEPLLYLLDAGIVVELGQDKHQHLVDVLAALMRHDGYQAGRLIVAKQPDIAPDKAEKFCTVLADITAHCADEAFFDHVGAYATRIFQSAATNHVRLPPYFVSTSIAIRVMEGVANALDKDVKIGNLAIPWILSKPTRRYTDES